MLLKSLVNHFFCNCLSLFLLLLHLHLQCYVIHNSIQSSSTIHKSHISNNTKSDTNGQETARSMRNWPSFTTIPNANNKNLNFLASMVVNNVEKMIRIWMTEMIRIELISFSSYSWGRLCIVISAILWPSFFYPFIFIWLATAYIAATTKTSDSNA